MNPTRQHLRLHSPEALAVDIQRTINITVSPREIAQPTPYLVELLYVKYIQIIFAVDFEDYLMDLHNEPDVVCTFVYRRVPAAAGAFVFVVAPGDLIAY
jgi:hypothetical protein